MALKSSFFRTSYVSGIIAGFLYICIRTATDGRTDEDVVMYECRTNVKKPSGRTVTVILRTNDVIGAICVSVIDALLFGR